MTTRRVLVIDDEEAIQEIIQACLEDLGGWEVLVAGSGSQGLLIAASEPLDGILLDVSMPEMNGFETLQKLQENLTTQKIPVTLLTARVQPEDKEQFAQLGIAGLILKPFDPLTLVEQVAEVFGW
ncbi:MULTISPECIES: response regulator [Trichocoleus]|uniref:Response regulator n=1 Tax=Trichocoleus desertorum GB2-A4 TaxID=2933944 RepID=A0ABV0JFG6_9CYAN|nr:response regulator [Trichocoleus sp. FACHB-46]MBD1865549.1 response regulator [Trichocoleus sp. FACHB-46]